MTRNWIKTTTFEYDEEGRLVKQVESTQEWDSVPVVTNFPTVWTTNTYTTGGAQWTQTSLDKDENDSRDDE